MRLYLQAADNKDAARCLEVLTLTTEQTALLQMIANDTGEAKIDISDDDWQTYGRLRLAAAKKAGDRQAVDELLGGR